MEDVDEINEQDLSTLKLRFQFEEKTITNRKQREAFARFRQDGRMRLDKNKSDRVEQTNFKFSTARKRHLMGIVTPRSKLDRNYTLTLHAEKALDAYEILEIEAGKRQITVEALLTEIMT